MNLPTHQKTSIELSGAAIAALAILRAAPGDMGQLSEYFPEQPCDDLANLLDDLAARNLAMFDETSGRWLCTCHAVELLSSRSIVVWLDSPTGETRKGSDQ